MAKQTIKFIRSEEVAEGTKAFYFEKPTGFEFKAGQTIDLTLINPAETDTEGNTRTFSIASAPHEDHLMIATRMRDTAFKRVLGKMQGREELEIDGPMGSYTLHNNIEKRAVFLTGGIGVTPVHSILLDAAKRKLEHKIYVFYSNRRPEDSAFLQELTSLVAEIPNATFVPTMTDMANSKKEWSGATGYISKDMLTKELPETSSAIFYIDGPATMVSAMRKMLGEIGVDEDNIRTEEFAGY
jgi:ferredoxin-NADP reductase